MMKIAILLLGMFLFVAAGFCRSEAMLVLAGLVGLVGLYCTTPRSE